MADKSKSFSPQTGRLNLLIMKSKGEVTTLSVSPVMLVVALLFTIIFIAVSVVVINKYFVLYFDHEELVATHHVTAQELHRLQSEFSYQSRIVLDYNKIVNAMNRADPQSGEDVTIPDSGELAPAEGPPTLTAPEAAASVSTLDDWAALFPNPSTPPEQRLNIEELRISGRNFSFQLVNESNDGKVDQGRLLMVFLAQDERGSSVLLPDPQFDINSPEANFNNGPGYNIRNSKQIAGQVDNVPPGSRIVEMMVVAKSNSGRVVLKKKVKPVG
ncbi:MAG: hypothetical protein LBV79_08380 [Candidatus Adiutrix sp.]|jgi:hypothetical protein|nr:hypothetical protein [Candidatus Adiutrix sp.]